MFKGEVYIRRREELHKKVKTGVALFIGNTEAPMNYPDNTYHFRQDSDFLYFFGLDLPGFIGLMDLDSGKDKIFGNDYDMDDIIWMGPQTTVKELALKCGINDTAPLNSLEKVLGDVLAKNRKIHFRNLAHGERDFKISHYLVNLNQRVG